MIMKLLSLTKHSFGKYFYSSCSVKDIFITKPEGSKRKLKVIFKCLYFFYYYINCNRQNKILVIQV